MNKRNKGKSYVKDNLGILNAVGILFICCIGPVVYWFTLILCDCMVCKKLLKAECLSRSWLDQGRMGVGGGGEVVKAKKQLFKPLILQGIDCYW